jgi:hypothetical protein
MPEIGAVVKPEIPSEQEVLRYFQELSNWGRWGEDDQLGTLNFITPEKRRKAASLISEGVSVSCSTTINYDATLDMPDPPMHFMIQSGEGWNTGDKITSSQTQVAMDYIAMRIHGGPVTHMDTPAHFFWEGKMYNGRPAHLNYDESRRDCRVNRTRERWHCDQRSPGRRADDSRRGLA